MLNKLLFVTLMLLAIVAPVRALAKDSSADVTTLFSNKTVRPGDRATIQVIVVVHEGLHAQSHKPLDEYAIPMVVTPDKSDAATFGEVEYPPGQEKEFPNLGKLSVYEGRTVIQIPVTIDSTAKAGPITFSGNLFFQACNEQVCFSPEKIKFTLDTTIVPPDQTVEKNAGFVQVQSSSSFFDLQHSGWVFVFSAAFLIGIIFNLMPCVLPVLPLKIMGFYEVSQHDRKKSVLLGAVFSAGLIASFGVLAALVVGSTKLNWGGLFQYTWFTVAISGVLVIMAISTFGFFTVNVPNALYSFTPRHDTYVGNFLFGILTAALSTPCTFGMFVGLLAWSLKQPPWVGGAAIVMVGVGMAFPYFVLSAVPEVARKFPRTGPWAEVVKQMMGFLLLATAVYFAQPLFQHVSKHAFWWAMFAVIAAGGIFLAVRTIQLSNNLLPRVIGIGLAVLLVGPAFGVVHRITWEPFEWVPYTPQALAMARASGNPVVIDFTADWCGNCHFIEAKVLHSSDVVRAIRDKNVVMIEADMTNGDAAARPLLNQFTAAGEIPLTAVYLPQHNQPQLLNGIYNKEDLLRALAVPLP